MIRCIGVKLINAQPMTRLAYNKLRGWELPADERGEDEGFLVEYLDGGLANVPGFTGYVSWSPKGVFERSYRPCDGMTFGLAIEALKAGKRVARAGWNGKGMWLSFVPGVRMEGAEVNNYNPSVEIKNVDGSMSTWAPSIGDSLAEDWCVVD